MSRRFLLPSLVVLGLLIVAGAAAVVSMGRPFSYDLLTNDGLTHARARAAWTNRWLARLGEVVLPVLGPGDTVYAPGFTEKVFSDIRTGTTESEVRQALGEPLLKKQFPDGTTVWYYSRHGERSKSYHVRAIEVDHQGRVARLFREYYLD